MNELVIFQEQNFLTINKTEGTQAAIQSTGPQGPPGATGAPGPSGATGAGVATGGNPGDILIKNSYNNYDTSWAATLDGGTFN